MAICAMAKRCKLAERCDHGILHEIEIECRHAFVCYDYRDDDGGTSAIAWCEMERQ